MRKKYKKFLAMFVIMAMCVNVVTLNTDAEVRITPKKEMEVSKKIAKSVQTIESGDYQYTVSEDIATITKYSGTEAILTIPEKIDGYIVGKIGISAFKGNPYLTEVNFSNNIKEVGVSAFDGCTKLEKIVLNEGITTLGGNFLTGTAVKELFIPKSVTDMYSSLYGNQSLVKIIFEDGMVKIPKYALGSPVTVNSKVEQVIIPDSVTEIGEGAFYECESLRSIDLPENLERIDSKAFWGCIKLQEIVLPEKVVEIEDGAFCECSSLVEVKLPDSVTKIGSSIFEKCSKLEKIVLNEGITTLGGNILTGTAVKELLIPKSVTEMHSSLYGAQSLVKVTFEDGMVKIPRYALGSLVTVNSKVEKVIIPDSVTEIEEGAFYECENLLNVYYAGTENDWKEISIKARNECLLNAIIHYNSTGLEEGYEQGLELKTITYWDDIDEVEKSAEVYWGSELFQIDSRKIDDTKPEYYANLVKVSALLAKNTYDLTVNGYLQKALSTLGFSGVVVNTGDEMNNPAHSFSCRDFKINGVNQSMIIVTIRGSSHVNDWITDFEATTSPLDIAYPKRHYGFSKACQKIKSELKLYIEELGIDTSTAKILITGHSYGGAVANLLAKSLEDTFAKSNIFSYNFAPPNNIVVEGTGGILGYGIINVFVWADNIHNFRNVWDPVVHIPKAPSIKEAYTIYGEQEFFTLEDIGDEPEKHLKDNHNCTHYVNYALRMSESKPITEMPVRYIRIRCPIDVEAYDENGNIVGRIIDNKVDESVTKIMMFASGAEKNIYIPADGSVRLSLIATDTGTMEVDIYDYDVVAGDISALKEFSNVELVTGKMFRTNITNDIATQDVPLMVVDENGKPLATVNEDGSEIPEDGQEYVKGDVNEDSSVDSADLRFILRSICGKTDFTERQTKIADVTGEGAVDSQDLRKVLRFICGKIDEL